MTTHMTKTWFEDGRIIKQVIPEAEIYKRTWVGLTDEEIWEEGADNIIDFYFARAIEAKLKEKNT
jgi:hypothetical protein